MRDKIEGYLEVGVNEKDEIVVNHGDLMPDENGVGHIVFSPNQARHLGNVLLRKAAEAETNIRAKIEAERRRARDSREGWNAEQS